MEVQADDKVGPRQIRDRATIVAMDALGRHLTHRAGITGRVGQEFDHGLVRCTINGEGIDTQIRIHG